MNLQDSIEPTLGHLGQMITIRQPNIRNWDAKRRVYEEIERMADLKFSSGAIIDLVYALAPSCCFEESSRCEWVLRPTNWIALHFSYGRNSKRLHVSLDIWPGNLDPIEGLEIKQGRFPSWSRVTIEDVRQLPAVLQYVLEASGVSGPRH